MITAVVENAICSPATSSECPSSPRRPNVYSSAMPATTGGRTSGSSTRERSRSWPRNRARASTSAIGTPSTTHRPVAIVEVRRLSRSAVRDDSEVIRDRKSAQSTRVSIATRGRAMNSMPSAAGANIQRRQVHPRRRGGRHGLRGTEPGVGQDLLALPLR